MKNRGFEITYSMIIFVFAIGMFSSIYFFIHSIGLGWKTLYALMFSVFVVGSFIAYWIVKVTGDDDVGEIKF